MPRTIGSKDRINKRKTRKDKGKKRKKYDGKPVKKKRKRHGRFVPYVPISEKRGVIKLWFWEKLQMSPEGYRRFSKETRQYMKPIIFKWRHRIDVPTSMISNKQDMENFCIYQAGLWDGTWYIMGFSHGKNKRGVKPVKLCEMYISNHPSGLKARMTRNFRLFRYSWWSKK